MRGKGTIKTVLHGILMLGNNILVSYDFTFVSKINSAIPPMSYVQVVHIHIYLSGFLRLK